MEDLKAKWFPSLVNILAIKRLANLSLLPSNEFHYDEGSNRRLGKVL